LKEETLQLYKFCSADDALKIIMSSKLMFSLVCNFNDPFDTSINNIKFDPSNVSTEYLKDIEYLKSKFGRDSISKTPKEAIANWVKKSAKSRIDELVITCFSRSHESPLMWAHYADKHHGICLEFTLTKYLSPFKKIKYESINTLEMNYEPPAAPINYLKDKKKPYTYLCLKSLSTGNMKKSIESQL